MSAQKWPDKVCSQNVFLAEDQVFRATSEFCSFERFNQTAELVRIWDFELIIEDLLLVNNCRLANFQ